mmetsp:Transcript_54246/g.94604  ORF Transcript_54246/g.94604 Transcript_54246/m.94604 type:complete len:360 (-) Transcript_54246:945-2024(-)
MLLLLLPAPNPPIPMFPPRLGRLPELPKAPAPKPPPAAARLLLLPKAPPRPPGCWDAPPGAAPKRLLLDAELPRPPNAGAPPNGPPAPLLPPKGPPVVAAGAPKGPVDAVTLPKGFAAGAKPPKAGAAAALLLALALAPNANDVVDGAAAGALLPKLNGCLASADGAAAGAPKLEEKGLPLTAPPPNAFEAAVVEGALWLEKLPVSIVEPGESVPTLLALVAPKVGSGVSAPAPLAPSLESTAATPGKPKVGLLRGLLEASGGLPAVEAEPAAPNRKGASVDALGAAVAPNVNGLGSVLLVAGIGATGRPKAPRAGPAVTAGVVAVPNGGTVLPNAGSAGRGVAAGLLEASGRLPNLKG